MSQALRYTLHKLEQFLPREPNNGLLFFCNSWNNTWPSDTLLKVISPSWATWALMLPFLMCLEAGVSKTSTSLSSLSTGSRAPGKPSTMAGPAPKLMLLVIIPVNRAKICHLWHMSQKILCLHHLIHGHENVVECNVQASYTVHYLQEKKRKKDENGEKNE